MRVQQPVLTTAESGHALRRHQGFAIRRRDRRGVGGRQAQPRHWRRDLVAAAHLYPRLLWLRRDTSDTGAVAALSQSTFWFVLPTLPMFLVLPALLRNGAGFWPALGLSCLVTLLLYAAMAWTLGKLGSSL